MIAAEIADTDHPRCECSTCRNTDGHKPMPQETPRPQRRRRRPSTRRTRGPGAPGHGESRSSAAATAPEPRPLTKAVAAQASSPGSREDMENGISPGPRPMGRVSGQATPEPHAAPFGSTQIALSSTWPGSRTARPPLPRDGRCAEPRHRRRAGSCAGRRGRVLPLRPAPASRRPPLHPAARSSLSLQARA